VSVSQTGEPQYEQLTMAYEVDRTRGGLSLVSLEPIQPAGETEGEPATSTDVDWNSARLSVEYPHPGGDPDIAQIRLHVSKHSHPSNDGLGGGPVGHQFDSPIALVSWTVESTDLESDPPGKAKLRLDSTLAPDEANEEVWVLDLPKRELDLLLFDLAGTGYFEDQTRPRGLAQLEVTIDGGHTAKIWTPEPRLDDLVARVYRDGRAEGFIASTQPEVDGAGWSF